MLETRMYELENTVQVAKALKYLVDHYPVKAEVKEKYTFLTAVSSQLDYAEKQLINLIEAEQLLAEADNMGILIKGEIKNG